MRWSLNLLPMLLLVGRLTAQDCSITNVAANVVDCANAQFFVNLNFQAENTGQQGFSVTLNGIPLGNFQYQNLPVVLGPLPAVAGVDYQLTVADLVDPTCSASTLLDLSSCAGLTCDDIVNLTVQTGDCNPDGSYELTLDFDAPNILPNLFFTVFTGTGDSLATYQLADLPVTISNYPNNGGTVDSVSICLQGVLNCCATTSFDVPNCPGNCDISNLSVETGACNPDGSYQIKLNFDYSQPASAPEFSVTGNGVNLGSFALADLPIEISHFPAGGATGVVTVCLHNNPNCCETLEFQAPNCPPDSSDCKVYNIRVKTDTCTSDTTYWVRINFKVDNPDSDSFTVYANSGVNLGTYAIADLPLVLTNFPYDGGTTDRITICVGPNCCATRKFRVPDCLPNILCDIYDLAVETGDCTSDSTYNLRVKFNTLGADADSVTITIDGNVIGTFLPDSMPIALTDVAWNGGNLAEIKVCYSDNCCETKHYPVPDCLPGVSCEIFDVRVQTGDCNDDGTAYSIKINFEVANPDADEFHLWGNNGDVDYGTFPLSALPLTIPDFPYEGGATDNIRICLSDNCCITRNFAVPDCVSDADCQVYDVRVRTGACNPDGTYRVRVSFKTLNATADSFNIIAGNGDVFGPFSLNDFPAFIKFFPASGDDFDELTVCLIDSSGDCCKTKKFPAPDCGGPDCEITNLVVDPGACNPDGSYSLVLNFATNITDPAVQFEVGGNSQSLGTFALGDLPLTILNFPNSNSPTGVVKVCIVGQPNCCATLEFQQPDCPTLCDIVDLSADPGDCNGDDDSYSLTLNFGLQTPGATTHFEVFGNGQSLGTYGIGDLPLTIDSFPGSSSSVGVLKVCLVDVPNCCAIVEFQQPDCSPNQDSTCAINDLAIEVGDCDPNGGTFSIKVDFSVSGSPAPDSVDIYGNDGSVNFGRFDVASAPILIINYPSTPGSSPTVKVCAADNPDCCASTEFQAPNCPTPDSCSIYDLQVLATPCISGQFFAIITFNFQGGSQQGFTINGNGTSYGSFSYGVTQPLIIGPLNGDGVTEYEFIVQDNEDAQCHDAVMLGIVECQVIDPRSGAIRGENLGIALSPNPVQDWLTVSTLLPAEMLDSRATVQVFSADGRLVYNRTVADARAFGLDVSGLQPGLYRLSVLTAAGRVNGTFAKQ